MLRVSRRRFWAKESLVLKADRDCFWYGQKHNEDSWIQRVGCHLRDIPVDLSFLYSHRVFRSQRSVDSHIQTARELADHNLRWRGGPIDTALYKASVRRVEIFALRYGAEVEITPRPFTDFVLVHVSLKGAAKVTADGQQMLLPAGRTGWIAPRHTWRMHWLTGTEQLIIKVPIDLLLKAAPEPGTSCRSAEIRPLGFLEEHVTAHWHSLLQTCMYAASVAHDSPASNDWVDHLEHAVGKFLVAYGMRDLHLHAHNAAPAHNVGQPDDALGVAQSRRCLEALENHIAQHLAAPLSLDDLSRAAGVSPRTLQSLCLRKLGVSPMEMLRTARLDAVHSRLRAGMNASVTDVALRCGFSHLGRFSAYYRQRFGELPSATAKRCDGRS